MPIVEELCSIWLDPLTGAGEYTPPSAESSLLLETGDVLLLETGDEMLLE